MAITHTIDPTDPDGTTKKVSYLDNAIRQLITDIQERMEDSIIDTGVTGWNTTTTKVLKEGIARVFTDALAGRPAFGRDGRLFIENTAPSNTDSFQYDTGAAWVDVPIGTDNLLANSVTIAKVASQTVHKFETEITSNIDHTHNAATWLSLGPTLRFTTTPNSTSSIMVYRLMGMAWKANGVGSNGQIRIRNTTDNVTVAEMRVARDTTAAATGAIPICMVGTMTIGAVAAKTVEVQIACSDANTFHFDGSLTDIDAATIPIRFACYEIKV